MWKICKLVLKPWKRTTYNLSSKFGNLDRINTLEAAKRRLIIRFSKVKTVTMKDSSIVTSLLRINFSQYLKRQISVTVNCAKRTTCVFRKYTRRVNHWTCWSSKTTWIVETVLRTWLIIKLMRQFEKSYNPKVLQIINSKLINFYLWAKKYHLPDQSLFS